jgi:tol-pal system protein YbgF
MIAKRILPAVLAAALTGAVSASAQNYPVDPPQDGRPAPADAVQAPPPAVEWDKKRLDRLERAVERLENTIARIKPDKAPPNLVEPDPEVLALEARADDLTNRVNDLESALRKVNGALDTANIEIDRSHKAEADARAASQALEARVTALEAKLSDMEKAAQAAAQPPQAAQVQPAAGGSGLPPGDPAADFKAAMDLLLGADFVNAGRAFQDFIAKYPNAPEIPEAHYRLAETYYGREDLKDAVVEYATAIQDWPRARWAPDATVKLAYAFDSLQKAHDACATLGEFERHYAKEAPASVKTRALALKSKAKCGAR